MMRFNRPGTVLERFLSRPLRPSDTHCSSFRNSPEFRRSPRAAETPIRALYNWTRQYSAAVRSAQEAYDADRRRKESRLAKTLLQYR
jgi:hypothetical protein